MSDTTASLSRKISSAGELQAVVRTMKAIAASSITQYENSVAALGDYYRTIELGLGACLRDQRATPAANAPQPMGNVATTGAVIFGTDQGLVGQFNEVLAEYAAKALGALPGRVEIWAVGERVHERLLDAGLTVAGLLSVPNSVQGIAPLVGRIQFESEAQREHGVYGSFYVFHNRPHPGALYEPVSQRLLPLDAEWQTTMSTNAWPKGSLPQVMGHGGATLRALLREYLFISLFRACAESLASENASRLAAMQRAEKNIGELLDTLKGGFHRLRQEGIDEELFDVVSGYEALAKDKAQEVQVAQAKSKEAHIPWFR